MKRQTEAALAMVFAPMRQQKIAGLFALLGQACRFCGAQSVIVSSCS
jgi:hypothetical protein